eukprot:4032_1
MLISISLVMLQQITSGQFDPTISNSTGSYYIASNSSGSSYFNGGSIICNDLTLCHVVCNERYSCQQLDLHVTSPTTLVIDCGERQSCRRANIYADNANSVNLNCNYLNNDYTSGACYYLNLYASQATTASIYCNELTCNSANFYIENVVYASLDSSGSYPGATGIGAIIYGAYITNGIDITCNGKGSCHDLDIVCINHNGTTVTYVYNDTKIANKCSSSPSYCCPLPPTNNPTTLDPTTSPITSKPTSSPITKEPTTPSTAPIQNPTHNPVAIQTTIRDPNESYRTSNCIPILIFISVLIMT